MSSLSPEQIALQLEALPDWSLEGNVLRKTYLFENFGDAIGFMVRVAFYAQDLEHYPLWQQNYNRLDVQIGDPNQCALHSRDIQLAKRLESAFLNVRSVDRA